jgi:hypothetical protein
MPVVHSSNWTGSAASDLFIRHRTEHGLFTVQCQRKQWQCPALNNLCKSNETASVDRNGSDVTARVVSQSFVAALGGDTSAITS